MQMTQLFPKLGSNDIKLVRRDRFLIFMLMFVVYIAVIVRFGLPWLNVYLAERGVLPSASMPIHLADLYPMLVTFFGLFNGMLLPGTVYGFMLLDEKDDNTLAAMLVTPVPLKQYLSYRVLVPTILAFFIILFMVLFIDQALLPLWQLTLMAAGAALGGPIVALAFAVFAENKVQGFAFSKFGGIAGWSILLGWFVPEPWQWLIGLFPPFWVSKAYWMALDGRPLWWLVLLIGIVLQLGLIALLLQRFNKAAYR